MSVTPAQKEKEEKKKVADAPDIFGELLTSDVKNSEDGSYQDPTEEARMKDIMMNIYGLTDDSKYSAIPAGVKEHFSTYAVEKVVPMIMQFEKFAKERDVLEKTVEGVKAEYSKLQDENEMIVSQTNKFVEKRGIKRQADAETPLDCFAVVCEMLKKSENSLAASQQKIGEQQKQISRLTNMSTAPKNLSRLMRREGKSVERDDQYEKQLVKFSSSKRSRVEEENEDDDMGGDDDDNGGTEEGYGNEEEEEEKQPIQRRSANKSKSVSSGNGKKTKEESNVIDISFTEGLIKKYRENGGKVNDDVPIVSQDALETVKRMFDPEMLKLLTEPKNFRYSKDDFKIQSMNRAKGSADSKEFE